MAKEPGLGTAERYLIATRRLARSTLNEPMDRADHIIAIESPCQACGACCSYSPNWPRFTTEDDAALDLIPEKFVNARLSGMHCEGDRCSALSGKVGEATSCTIYAVRPEVCRTCMPGDPECAMARKRHGLPLLG
jgi:Fe-S-cluster containining protein